MSIIQLMGGATVTQNLSSLNIAPFTTFSFTHPTLLGIRPATGAYILEFMDF